MSIRCITFSTTTREIRAALRAEQVARHAADRLRDRLRAEDLLTLELADPEDARAEERLPHVNAVLHDRVDDLALAVHLRDRRTGHQAALHEQQPARLLEARSRCGRW